MTRWSLEQDTAGRGVVKHHALPRFTAHWTSGTDGMAALDGQCWSDQGSGDGVDSLHLFGFQWLDAASDPQKLEKLMQEAAKVIDAWIAARM